MPEKRYLGDGVYVEIDNDFQLKLTTSNGITELEKIYMEPWLFKRLQDYFEEWMAEYPESSLQ